MKQQNHQAGFAGPGKVGCSLGMLFAACGLPLAGYAGRNAASTIAAAKLTGTRSFADITELVAASDILFLTVPDGSITSVWEEIRHLPLAGKIVCHCSGSLPAAILEHSTELCTGACSLHPLYAVSSRDAAWQGQRTAVFTLEGDAAAVKGMQKWLVPANLQIQLLNDVDKTLYHAAAVFASNLMIGLAQEACDLLEGCGFSPDRALQALRPLLAGNMQRLFDMGPDRALTGPIERNDCQTVAHHLAALHGDSREVYRLLSARLVRTAAAMHPQRDMYRLRNLLGRRMEEH